MAIAKEVVYLTEAEDIEWKEGHVEYLPFEDETFMILSIFGHIFSPHPEVAIKEMLRVTKSGEGGRIAFATWPAELANGRLFAAIAKHVSYPCVDNELHPPPPSPTLWGIPEVIKKTPWQ